MQIILKYNKFLLYTFIKNNASWSLNIVLYVYVNKDLKIMIIG